MVAEAFLVGLSLFLLVLCVLWCSVESAASPSLDWHAASSTSLMSDLDGPL